MSRMRNGRPSGVDVVTWQERLHAAKAELEELTGGKIAITMDQGAAYGKVTGIEFFPYEAEPRLRRSV